MPGANEPLFLPASFFAVRTPCFAISDFFRLLNATNLNEELLSLYIREPFLQEAIFIASPSLFEALEKIENKNKKEKDQIFSSLLKYVIRMATRSTPFGLFAFVSLGSWSEKNAVTLDLKKITKYARPDMKWLSALIDQISTNKSISASLPVKTNPLISKSAGRINLNYIRENATKEGKVPLSIRSSFLTEAILELAKRPLSVFDLEEKILALFPSLEREKTREVIETLVSKQFLSVTLLPSLLSKSPFEDLLNHFANINELFSELDSLQTISKLINQYNAPSLEMDKFSVHLLQTSMLKILKTHEFPLQVDAIYPGNTLTLPVNISNELSEAAEVLWKLSYGITHVNPLLSYHEKFLNKYGSNRVVPLLELLNEDLSLGSPYIKDYSLEDFSLSSHTKKWDKWLARELNACLYEGRKEIELSEEIIDKVIGKVDKNKAFLSFDLTCEVIANSSQEVLEGNFLLYIAFNTWQAGSTIGRFLDALGEEAIDKVQDLLIQEESLEPECIYADSSFMPFKIRLANVGIHPNLRQYAIDLGNSSKTREEGQIFLEDIFVGATNDRFFLTLKNQQKELIVKSCHLINSDSAPLPIRFLIDVSTSKHIPIVPFSWGSSEEAAFLPRVRFKKSVLSPAQWRVDLDLLKATGKESQEEISKKFSEWADRWDLPQYLFLTVNDHRILLDRTHLQHVKEITLRLIKKEEIKLIEKLGQDKGDWIKSERGHHLSEFVVPFVKNQKFTRRQAISSFPNYTPSIDKQRLKLPGSEWLFAKFFLNKEGENSFLTQHLMAFVDHFQKQNIINGCFFIRYNEHGSHLRVRFRGDRETITSLFFPAFHAWIIGLHEEKIIKEMNISSYEREIERYGGEELIESAETFFCSDSSTVMHLLRGIMGKKLKLPDYVVAALSIINLLKEFELNLEESIAFFALSELSKEELKGYRDWKIPLSSLSRAIITYHPQVSEEAHILYSCFNLRKEALQIYYGRMQKLGMRKNPTEKFYPILESLIHMHCNRLMGTNLSLERKARLYAHQALLGLRFETAAKVP